MPADLAKKADMDGGEEEGWWRGTEIDTEEMKDIRGNRRRGEDVVQEGWKIRTHEIANAKGR